MGPRDKISCTHLEKSMPLETITDLSHSVLNGLSCHYESFLSLLFVEFIHCAELFLFTCKLKCKSEGQIFSKISRCSTTLALWPHLSLFFFSSILALFILLLSISSWKQCTAWSKKKTFYRTRNRNNSGIFRNLELWKHLFIYFKIPVRMIQHYYRRKFFS